MFKANIQFVCYILEVQYSISNSKGEELCKYINSQTILLEP